jgi:hypothetical protein
MRKVVRIERVAPVENAIEEPILTPKGYKMADPGAGPEGPRPAHAIFQSNLEGVAAGLQKGLSLWMRSGDAGEMLVPANKSGWSMPESRAGITSGRAGASAEALPWTQLAWTEPRRLRELVSWSRSSPRSASRLRLSSLAR